MCLIEKYYNSDSYYLFNKIILDVFDWSNVWNHSEFVEIIATGFAKSWYLTVILPNSLLILGIIFSNENTKLKSIVEWLHCAH